MRDRLGLPRGFVGLEGTDAGGFRQLPCRVQFQLDELEKLWSLKSRFDKWKQVLSGEAKINYLARFFEADHQAHRQAERSPGLPDQAA
ncbi:hypothetical protein OF385_02820 [Glutamicibacter sp. JL.03c]|uniref:hypothetical protein n=1 Tax=Glutamicibacter sp. JL.03c TaxID=2984842 RepID=UPI0021F6ED29|nr:hypothetical protein [Glutamicibacter sp. JL.03c]UYQ78110.1 hypothetical protein OF385_02820 [Glutamicibacter sp. JL.03c]